MFTTDTKQKILEFIRQNGSAKTLPDQAASAGNAKPLLSTQESPAKPLPDQAASASAGSAKTLLSAQDGSAKSIPPQDPPKAGQVEDAIRTIRLDMDRLAGGPKIPRRP